MKGVGRSSCVLEIWVMEKLILHTNVDLLYDEMNMGDINTNKKKLQSLPVNLHYTYLNNQQALSHDFNDKYKRNEL